MPAKRTVPRSSRPKRPRPRHAPAVGGVAEVEITHPDKVMFPERGYTKADVVGFYRAVAPRLLPHLRDRPITLQRFPDGVGEGRVAFWQKNTPDHYPDWISRIELSSETGKVVRYALVNDERTLIYLVNQGAVTFHPFLSRTVDLDRPDYVLFDLDPGAATFANAVTIARRLRELLDAEGITAVPKTSGKTGLHVLVPWAQPGGYDEARAWAMDRAEHVVRDLPDVATVERTKRARGRRVYVDVIQNARAHHAVPAYVLRATPGATVSTPLRWDEVTPKLRPERFDLKTAPPRFQRQREDPIAALAGPAAREARMTNG